MQQGDYTSPYYHYPNFPTSNATPHPPDQSPAPYASAPPYSTTGYTPSDYSASYSSYPPYPQNPDPAPTAPSYAAPPNPSPSPNLPPPTYNQPIQQPLPPSSLPPYDSHTAYQPPVQQQTQPYYSAPQPSYDQPPQVPPAYSAPPASYDQPPAYTAPISGSSNLNPNTVHGPGTNPPYSSTYTSSAPYNPSSYESPYNSSTKYDQAGSGFFDDKYGSYGRSQSSVSSDVYGKQSGVSLYGDTGRTSVSSDVYGKQSGVSLYGDTGRDDSYGDGVYAYRGGKVEPYGSRGTAPKSSTWSGSAFDDYGRSISHNSVKESSSASSPKIVRAVPKADTQQDVKSGVQKFRVKLLPESGSQGTMDVICQIGLDGIKMLDPSTGRTLRIYPLENVTRCEVTDSSTLSFWSKSPVDIEPRRIRLQSSSYTTNTLLDIVTAATVQLKEMGGQIRPQDTSKMNEQPGEKKKGFGDWMNIIKPGNEEKDHWVPDDAVTKCTSCGSDFNAFTRKHHCRNCGDIFCDKCTHGRIALTAEENAPLVRVCDRCLAEVTQRLSNAKEVANKPAVQSHEDLARKLQEEMEKNRRSASGSSRSDGSGKRMREVACPICTVHLQVQVPASGSETIECGVCQHPFLVSAN